MHKKSWNRLRRTAALITAVVMTAGMISGCTDSQQNQEGTTAPQAAADNTEVSESATQTEGTTETTAEPVDSEEDIISTDFSLSPVVTSVTADSMEGSLILTDSDFTLTTSSDMEESELKSLLSITPDIPFEVSKVADCSYKLDCSGNFPENSTAVLRLSDENGDTAYKWSFQTYGDFEPLEYYPYDGAESADTATGIEIRFSSEVSVKNAEDYFSISPKVTGEFKSYRSTLYFIPHEELESSTYYKVEVAKGFPSADGAPLKEDISFTFRTQSDSDKYYIFAADDTETYIPGDSVITEIYCSDALKSNTQEYSVELFRYNSADDYFNALKDYSENGINTNDYVFPTDGMKTAYTDTVTLQRDTRKNYGPAYLVLPDNLEKGYYIANISTKLNDTTFSIQRHIQISDISVYSSDIQGNTVFFINDVKTGGAASGAKIEINREGGVVSGTADSQGIANIDIASEKYGNGVLKITYNGEVFCDLYSYNESLAERMDELYYSYVYTDRETYMTTDKINIWGVVIPKRAGISIPKNTYIRMEDYDTAMSDDIPVTLDENGFFTTELEFEKHEEIWWITLKLYSDDKVIGSKSVNIRDYEKPLYIYDVTLPEYSMYPQSVPVTASLDVSFYEGTSAKNVQFSVGGYEMTKEKDDLITDTMGHIETELLYEDHDSWYPQYCNVNFTPSGIQDEYSYISDSFIGFFRDIMLTHETDHDKNSVTLYTNKIDPSKMEYVSGSYYSYYEYGDNYEKIKGAPADTTVTAVLYRSWYEKIEKGSYYDFLLKETVKNYDYEHHEEKLGTYTVNTSGGKGVINDLPIDIEDSHYYMELTWKDSLGNTVRDSISLTDYSYYYNRGSYRYYTFACNDTEFRENQALEFTLDSYSSETPFEGGRVLFQVYRNDFLSNSVYTTETFSHTMTADYIPNVGVCGAYFDGRHVYPVHPTDYYGCLSFDPSDREIIIEVTSDKETYLPGDSASLSVKAYDTQGKPVENAVIHLSVVDEAAFAITNQIADPLNYIYEDVSMGYPTQYFSYIQHCLDTYGGGEKGGGGDDYYIRKDFKDTAAFVSAATGSDGCASFDVKLPDNLTTWRATVQAVKNVSEGVVYAGTTKYPVVVTQPLFIVPVAATEFLEGDDLCFSAVCFGNSDKDEAITVTLSGKDYEKSLSVPSGRSANFGKLPIGEYKVLFTAEGNGGKDAIELPVTVTDTLLEADITKSFALKDGIDIDPVRWPVQISFFDKEYMQYTDILFTLMSKYYNRLDMRIASRFAFKELGFMSEEEYISECRCITENGLLRLMENSETSTELTALVCLAEPSLIDKRSVIETMYRIINNSESKHGDRANAYLALAALNEPVGNEIVRLLEETDDIDRSYSYSTSSKTGFDYSDCMILCTALAAAGDFDNAIRFYSDLANKAVISKDADGNTTMLIRSAGSDMETTAQALMTASILGLDEADPMARYLETSKEIYDTYVLELMVYLKNYTPDIEGDAVFTYNRGGKTETVELDRHFGTRLYFTKDQLKNADFTITSGDVYAIANYTGRTSEYGENQGLKITKSVQGKMEIGSLVTVRITVTNGKRNHFYSIKDVIPSCGRYVGPVNYSDNKINLYCYSDTSAPYAEYTFRIVSDGEYIVESAAVRDNEGEWGMSSRNTIKVQGYESST